MENDNQLYSCLKYKSLSLLTVVENQDSREQVFWVPKVKQMVMQDSLGELKI